MSYDYFTPGEAEQYAFFRIPKLLITGDQFRNLSMEAKLLYGILLDRVSLSLKNGWVDENNHVYIIYTIEQIMKEMNCSNKKAVTMLSELEKKVSLVEKKRQGLGKPNLIYVKNFFTKDQQDCGVVHTESNAPVDNLAGEAAEMSNVHPQKCKNDTSGRVENTSAEMSEVHGSNTNNNNTDLSNTNPISSYQEMRSDAMRANYTAYRNYFMKQLEIEYLIQDEPDEKDTINGILDILVETCSTTRSSVWISGSEIPIEVVRGKLMKLTSSHITYVLHCLHENTSMVRNIRQYLLATLYNAPTTIGPYYRAWVNHDMASGLV
ncbi:MAG: DUF6017 domain-containing protein [Eubacteriales bacterium]|nr:DUF6017 domain-containing protein [Eubacteriales bacterium]